MIPNIPEILHPQRFTEVDLPREKLEFALSEALKKIDKAIDYFGPELFPCESSRNNVYGRRNNDGGWGCGFWTGILWHAYEMTGDDKYKAAALAHLPGFKKRIVEKLGVNHHDMGFCYTPSCVAAWKLVGDETGKEAAVMAAEHLATRYHDLGKFIQAWGAVDNPEAYRLIIDCLLNIPLLYWAAEVTGEKKFDEMAYNHFNTTIEVCCRADASTYHTYYFDPKTGDPVRGVTHQGAFDDSAWARGQAWGIYGPMLTYIYKKDERALTVFKATTNYLLNHLPEDYIPYWDLSFGDGDGEPKDSSTAVIAMCGMLEAIKYMDESDPLRKIYVGAIKRMMNVLIDNYISKDIPESNGLLLHQVYAKPQGIGVDELNIWGDYFYIEALHRLLDPEWKLYW